MEIVVVLDPFIFRRVLDLAFHLFFWFWFWSIWIIILYWVKSCRKTRGMGAGRKLKSHRRRQRWADKSYKKSHLGNEWKKPFAGSSHAKGIVLEKMWGKKLLYEFAWEDAKGTLLLVLTNFFSLFNRGIEAKQPNSAIRKCARVQLIKNGKKIAAFVPNDGCLNYIEENVSQILISFPHWSYVYYSSHQMQL